jgi:class 3 adenylate cyclase/predicted ATPase
MSAVGDWLRSLSLGIYVEAFERNAVDVPDIPDLSDEELIGLGVALGHRKRIRRAARSFAASSPSDLALTPNQGPVAGAALEERRRVSVMFCDLVGSTQMTNELGLEATSLLLRQFRREVEQAVVQCGGTIARFIGDGVLAVFGYPTARGNDAERAVRAALAIGEACAAARWQGGRRVHTRIALATGDILVRLWLAQTTIDPDIMVGSALNLASKLQVHAPEDGVIIDRDTYQIVRPFYEARALGARAIPGFPTPVHAWVVVKPRVVLSRFRASATSWRSPLLGRETEMRTLALLWSKAQVGNGQFAVLIGEPGIGKSRLVEEFVGTLPTGRLAPLFFGASPLGINSPYQPIVDLLGQVARLRPADSLRGRRRKLQILLRKTSADPNATIAALAPLLALNEPDRGTPALPPSRVRSNLVSALMQEIRNLCRVEPLVVVVEDHHWLDPSSVELLGRLIELARDTPLFVIVTSRTPITEMWREEDNVSLLPIGRLSSASVREMTLALRDDKSVPKVVMQQLVNRAEGIPLFVEALVESLGAGSVLEAGWLERDRSEPSIPAAIYEIAMARLDHAIGAKHVVQVAAAIGRVVEPRLIALVAGLEQAEVDSSLASLVSADILYRDLVSSDARFVFRHVMLQEAAYSSLTNERRRQVHKAISRALPIYDPRVTTEQPQLLAHHLTEAGMESDAIVYWIDAARRNVARSANTEAESQLRAALKILARLPQTPQRLESQLEALLLLGTVLISLRGPGSTEVASVYTQALQICEKVPDSRHLFTAFWGWWRISRNFTEMKARADHLHGQAMARGDEELLVQSYHSKWASHFHVGDLPGSVEHIDSGLAIYARGDFRHHATLYGSHDARVCAHGECALVYWLQGFPERALVEEERSLGWAQSLQHDGSSAHAMDYALVHRFMRRDVEAVVRQSAAMSRFATERGFDGHVVKASIFDGWAMAQQGRVREGRALLERGVEGQQRNDTAEDLPFYFAMLAETLILDKAFAIAQARLRDALANFDAIGLAMWKPELLRLSAIVDIKLDPGAKDAVTGRLLQARALACAQGAPALERRIDVAFARLLPGTDAEIAALGRLAQSVAGERKRKGATETPDLRDIRDVLMSSAPADPPPTRFARAAAADMTFE